MTPVNVSYRRAAPAGYTLNDPAGMSSSTVCQNPAGCTALPPQGAVPAAPAPAPMVEPMGTPAQISLGIEPVQRAAARTVRSTDQICIPRADGTSDCVTRPIDLAARAAPVVLPTIDPAFTNASGGDPLDVWRAQMLRNMANAAGGASMVVADPNKAVVTALMGGSAGRADALRQQGVDYDTAQAIATRSAIEDAGYTAAGAIAGYTPSATKLINATAQREADRGFISGTGITPAGRAMMAYAPGTLVTSQGRLYQVAADGQRLVPMNDSAAQDPQTLGLLIGGDSRTAVQQRAKDSARLAQAIAPAVIREQGDITQAGVTAGSRVTAAQIRAQDMARRRAEAEQRRVGDRLRTEKNKNAQSALRSIDALAL